MRHSVPVLASIVAALAGAGAAEAGRPISLPEKVFQAELILEYELTFDEGVLRAADRTGPNAVYPGGPLGAALEKARIGRQLLPAGKPPKRAPKLGYVAGSNAECLKAAAAKGRIRVLGFFKKDGKGRWRQIFGVELMLPAHSDLDPNYPQLVAAIEAAVTWRETPEAAEAAARSENPTLRRLAAYWLPRNGRGEVADAPPGQTAWPEDRPAGCSPASP